MNNDTQIFKGILEGCILKMIEHEAMYGYRAVEKLKNVGFEVNEATVYPILLRLQNGGHLVVDKRPSPLGPTRKYYSLTQKGERALRQFERTWGRIKNVVDNVMGGD